MVRMRVIEAQNLHLFFPCHRLRPEQFLRGNRVAPPRLRIGIGACDYAHYFVFNLVTAAQ